MYHNNRYSNFIPAPNCFGNCPNPQGIYYYPPPGGGPCPSSHPNSQPPNCAQQPNLPGITSTFTNNMMAGYNQFGCSFLYNRQGVLQNKLNQLVSAGTNPLWQRMLQNRITYMSNMIMNNCTGGPTPPPPMPPRPLPPSGPQAPQVPQAPMMNAIGDDEFNPNPPITTTSGKMDPGGNVIEIGPYGWKKDEFNPNPPITPTSGRITTTGGGQCSSDSDCGGGRRCVNGYCQTTTRSRRVPPGTYLPGIPAVGRNLPKNFEDIEDMGRPERFSGYSGTWMKSDY